MKQHTETLIDEKGFELMVSYNIYKGQVNEIISVELVIKGRGIEILPALTSRQLGHIADELTPEEIEEIQEQE